MTKLSLLTKLLVCFSLGGAFAAGSSAAQTATAVGKLDQTRITGTWYEVANLPNKRERNCVRDALQLIALGDKSNQFEFVFYCHDKGGYGAVTNKTGRAKDGSGAIKVPVFFFLISTKYWILDVAPDYSWALAGNPNHKTLWILSKSPAMDPATLAEARAKAAAQGFDVSKLTMFPQSKAGASPSAPASSLY